MGVTMITKTKILLLGTVFALGVAAIDTSFAADLPRKAPAAAPIYPPPAATWAGCYVGAAAGAVNHRASGNVDLTFDFEGGTIPFGSGAASKTGGIFGGYLGCQGQNRAFVYGIEGDFSGLTGTSVRQAGFETLEIQSKLSWLATVRGRAGLAVDNAMVYVTGGVAFANVKAQFVFPNDTDIVDNWHSNTRVGWTIGAGVEYMFTPNWIGRLEFLYADLGRHTKNFNVDDVTYTSRLSHELMIGRVGIAYKW
jgi:outer membrane immunogenic protein